MSNLFRSSPMYDTYEIIRDSDALSKDDKEELFYDDAEEGHANWDSDDLRTGEPSRA